MKKYNQSIQITVELDSIAQQLLNSFHPEHPHRELLVDTIIGNMRQETRQITQLYNSLNGFTNDIDFVVGQKLEVKVNALVGDYYLHESWKKDGTEPRTTLTATIVEVDVYRENKLKVSFEYMDRRGNMDDSTTWLNHTSDSIVSRLEATPVTSDTLAMIIDKM